VLIGPSGTFTRSIGPSRTFTRTIRNVPGRLVPDSEVPHPRILGHGRECRQSFHALERAARGVDRVVPGSNDDGVQSLSTASRRGSGPVSGDHSAEHSSAMPTSMLVAAPPEERSDGPDNPRLRRVYDASVADTPCSRHKASAMLPLRSLLSDSMPMELVEFSMADDGRRCARRLPTPTTWSGGAHSDHLRTMDPRVQT
jgi:hypothetical protein